MLRVAIFVMRIRASMSIRTKMTRTGISPSRPAAENATMTLRQDALPASSGQRLPTWGSSPSMARSDEMAQWFV